ncbi:UNVERIFIED_CONTAM: hypothetical protein FKN15_047101, partial [Acipenser sinensis]
CGGELTGTYGSINSPGYPGNYPPNRDCYWTISVNPGLLITFSFGTLSLEHHDNCNYDYLEFRDGLLPEDAALGKYCSTGSPPPLQTTGPYAWVHFHSDFTISDRGFHITYTTSPCEYCQTVRDGSSETNALIGKYCGSELPAPITSTSNRLWIKFKSDASITKGGFRAIYQVACGGVLSGTGTIRTPYHPNAYPHDKTCAWVITQPAGQVVTLNFLSFDIESHGSCAFDYVELRDGATASSPLIGKYCGTQIPAPAQSTQRSMYIRFVTDSSVTNFGFTAEYGSAEAGCGETLTGPTGTITSPGHPTNYPHGANCTWYISVVPGHIVRLTFTSFNMEFHHNCDYDYVEVYDNGTVATGTKLGRYCGRSAPPSLTSTDNMMTLLFVSDSSISTEGFSASYVSINATTDCGEVYTAPTGTLTSPNYPNNYPNSRQCIYKIIVETNRQIMLNFTDFILEHTYPSCSFDHIEIRDGGYETSPLIGKYCGTYTPPLVISHSNRLWIKFSSDVTVTYKGFMAHWDGTLSGRKLCESTELYYVVPLQKSIAKMLYDGPNDQSNLIGTFCGNTPPPANSTTGTSLHVVFVSDPSVSRSGFQMLWYQNGCGGELFGPHGLFNSPGYPSRYPDNRECIWHIQAAPESSIQITIHEFDVEYHPDCSYDVLEVYDGLNSQAPLLGKLCGLDRPTPITSTQSTIYVRFRSDSSNNHKGFSAGFSEACGSVITTDDIGGAIASPMYPNNYPSNQNCSWIIQAQEPCRYCGTAVPHPATSFSNALVVNFISNGQDSDKGFRATYGASTSACGGALYMETGAFNSPNYPDTYPSNIECVWNILSSPGNRLQLSFTMLQLQPSPNCVNDYLEIREGNATGHLVGRFCGNSLPVNYTSVIGHILWVKFVSDGSIGGAGFRATFAHLYGNEITGSAGQIASPLWPRDYPDNADYRWTITVNADYFIRVWIFEMDVEDTYECYFDKLKIFDGPSVHSYQLGTFCGLHPPPPVSSSGSSMTLEFQSDDSVSGRGFMLEWLAIEASGALPTIAPGACGGALMTGDSPSFLFSPGWPSDYQNNLECTWVIRSPDSTVELNILSVDIESHSSCFYDSLVIRDGETNVSPLLATVCGRELPGPIRSTGDAMFIRFTADGSYSGGGFNASYHKSCGGLLHADRGVLTSPNHPQTYTPNLSCSWHVAVTSGLTVAVHFEQPFQIQGYGTACSSGDYLELRNGPDASSPPLGSSSENGRYCGSATPSTMHTTDNQLFLRFISDGSNEGQGFKLTYEALSLSCGGNIYMSDSDLSGYITSPNYPNNYPQNVDCSWTITVPNGEAVQLDFEGEFYIEPTASCSYDYLELRDGASPNAPLIAKICGQEHPSTQKSTGSVMYLRFRTDSSVTHKGFKAKYSIATCGGRLIGQTGTLHSPGHPESNYPDNSHCEWYLQGPAGHYLTISFTALDLQASTDCSNDYVEVREHNATGRLLGKHCGNIPPSPVDTSDSDAYVKFVSDASVSASGFSLRFDASVEGGYCGDVDSGTQVKSSGNTMAVVFITDASVSNGSFSADYTSDEEAVCGGILNVPDGGNFTSPGYDGESSYANNLNCEWIIQNPSHLNSSISISFDDFHLEHHQTCEWDYNEFRFGNANGELLARFCGQSVPAVPLVVYAPQIWVHFLSDYTMGDIGFHAKYAFTGCGGLQSGVSGVVASPSYPSPYDNVNRCAWLLEAPEGCGGTIHADSGTIKSPGYPQNFPTNSCGANFTAPAGRVVSPNYPEHYPINSNCNYLIDAGNQKIVVLRFETFQVESCGGIFNQSTGTVSSPTHSVSDYHSNMNCTYHIIVGNNRVVELKFNSFHLEASSNCAYDYIAVYDGANTLAPLLGKFCGTVIPSTLQSSSNNLFLVFKTDYSVNTGGWRATFRQTLGPQQGCGGYLTSPSGSFGSPDIDFDGKYEASLDCVWNIVVPQNMNVNLTFSNFVLEGPSGAICRYDYVKVFDGDNENFPLVGTFCGNTVPASFASSNNFLTVKFVSDSSVSFSGFNATYTAVELTCGGPHNASTTLQTISSPTSSNPYPSSTNCRWTLDAPAQENVKLSVQRFHLPPSQSCSHDYLEFKDWPMGDYGQVHRFCGTDTTIPDFYTYGRTVMVTYKSDHYLAENGFSVTYEIAGCSREYNQTFGYLKSPGWPGIYHQNLNCVIILRAPKTMPSHSSSMPLIWSLTQPAAMTIWRNGSTASDTLLGKYCGQALPNPVFPNSNLLYLHFQSDFSQSRNGFEITWTSSPNGCGGTLYGDHGSFTSPNYPGTYNNNTDCEWTIVAPVGRVVTVNFAFISIDDPGDCVSNYLKLYDGPDASTPPVGPYCGLKMSKSLKKIVEETREKNLTEVDMCDRSISNMLDISGLYTLSNITQLVLSHNKLTRAFLDDYCKLCSLKNVLMNRLNSLPRGFGSLPGLEVLDLTYNNLNESSLPGNFFYLTTLRALYLSDNDFEILPPDIGKLTKLQILSLRDNDLISMPKEIGDLSQLKELHIQGNRLTVLPPELGNLDLTGPKQVFKAENNPWVTPIADQFQLGVSHVFEYVRSETYK